MCELRPAFTDRAMASRRARRIHWTRNARNHSRLIFHSKPRRKQRAASFGCFDDKDHTTQRTHEPISTRKILWPRHDAARKLRRYSPAAFNDRIKEPRMLWRIEMTESTA